ncbi:hypothetical protein [Bacillus sp. 2205SS5-2]|uniref:hypothetical protein n=1 Tax=Bacillus sp. 2205SS5-2 TaxID=3109031 RepID=UPI0030055475
MFSQIIKLAIATFLAYLYIKWVGDLFEKDPVATITNLVLNPVLFFAASLAFMGSFFFYTDLLQNWIISFWKDKKFRKLSLYLSLGGYITVIVALCQLSFIFTLFLILSSMLFSITASRKII